MLVLHNSIQRTNIRASEAKNKRTRGGRSCPEQHRRGTNDSISRLSEHPLNPPVTFLLIARPSLGSPSKHPPPDMGFRFGPCPRSGLRSRSSCIRHAFGSCRQRQRDLGGSPIFDRTRVRGLTRNHSARTSKGHRCLIPGAPAVVTAATRVTGGRLNPVTEPLVFRSDGMLRILFVPGPNDFFFRRMIFSSNGRGSAHRDSPSMAFPRLRHWLTAIGRPAF